MKKWEKEIWAYGLKNAIEHGGKAQTGAVISGLFNEGLKKASVKTVIPLVSSILKKINSMSSGEQEKEFRKYEDVVGHRKEREGLPELPNVGKKGVVMRFAPAASGNLHVGHVISNMISSLYVRKYGGKFYIRIEDIDPDRVDKAAYDKIKEDCDWVFGNVSEYIIQSDRIKEHYKYAKKLIDKNAAYVCTCSTEKFRDLVNMKKACPCRKNKKEENIRRWKKMLDIDGYKTGEAVLRFKSDIKDPNPAMRDFPLARINEKPHPRQGDKFKVWSLMNLAVTVDDIDYGMTHVIRGKDHKDNAARQKMIYKALGLQKKYPEVFFMGKIKFSDIDLSKRKIAAAIKQGKFSGAEDVRLPTLVSLRKRGYKAEAFAKFAEQRGLSEVDKVMTQKDFFEILDSFNKKS